jgi:hypothetical protein
MFSKYASSVSHSLPRRALTLVAFHSFMLALLSICVSRVILQLSDLLQAYTVDPLSKAPALLAHTAMIDRVMWERKMGCLVFMPPRDEDMFSEDEMNDDYY